MHQVALFPFVECTPLSFPVCSVCRGERTVYLPFMKLIAAKIYNMTQFLQNPFPADIVLAESKQSCGKGKQQQDAQHRW